jgi:hypothetical protein
LETFAKVFEHGGATRKHDILQGCQSAFVPELEYSKYLVQSTAGVNGGTLDALVDHRR